MKKIFLFLTLFFVMPAFSQQIKVEVTPTSKITTATERIQEGDYLDFKLVDDCLLHKKGEIVSGLVKDYVPNGFAGEHAQLLIENFEFENGDKLNGYIMLQGNKHHTLEHFIDGFLNSCSLMLRGGEVKILPNKDKFILYMEK